MSQKQQRQLRHLILTDLYEQHLHTLIQDREDWDNYKFKHTQIQQWYKKRGTPISACMAGWIARQIYNSHNHGAVTRTDRGKYRLNVGKWREAHNGH